LLYFSFLKILNSCIPWQESCQCLCDLRAPLQLYNDSQLKIDMIADVFNFGDSFAHIEDYIKHNKIEVGKIFQMKKAVHLIVNSLSHLLI
jgi:hypothetical protein